MPRQVDHEERRRDLAEAVWDVVLDHGFEQLTVRRIADAAGWTTGVVQHYFPTKKSLVRYAFELVQSRALERLARAAGSAGPGAVRAAVASLLPLDRSGVAESQVWFAFLGAAAADPELSAVAEQGRRDIVAAVGETLCSSDDVELDDATRSALAFDLVVIADGINAAAVYSRPRLRSADIAETMDRLVSARLASAGLPADR